MVDLDCTFLKVDTLFELFVGGLFTRPLQTIMSLLSLRRGIAVFKKRLISVVKLNFDVAPVNEELLVFLEHEFAEGREIHLATAADIEIASGIAARFPIFKTVSGSDGIVNLKGKNKADRLSTLFPDGYAYAGDSSADIPVWERARTAIIVASNQSRARSLARALESSDTPVERLFIGQRSQKSPWFRAIRPHQWAKNLIVMVPVALGWRDVTLDALLTTVIMIGLLCVVASATYLLNDMADLASDRMHWSKRRRGFASGAIPVRDGMLVVGLILPAALIVAWFVSASACLCLLLYVAVTLGYSFGWKRIPLLDTFIIASLFTIRILIGVTAAQLVPSAWLLTFSMFFFFSLAMAKRHTEILRAAEHGLEKLQGRGYQIGDESLTLAFGSAASMASIVIVVLYLVEEIFARQIYHSPAWLWGAPIAIFLFSCRIWVLSHRGRMTDDPVAFALRDNVSLGLGVFVAIVIALAL